MHRITAASTHGNKKIIELFKKRLLKYTEYTSLTTDPKPLPNDVLNTAVNKFNNDGLQHLDKLFPRCEEFPARHIGPREHEQTQMLELLGFRVSNKLVSTVMGIMKNTIFNISELKKKFILFCFSLQFTYF
jgi:hypothetical protein